ncbi:hypothetical protein ANO11243_008870 [Dothideomycetidae sp. 11243]|nr:hypothetical protein ANO11243_008870 [fungal sp. No.11243]
MAVADMALPRTAFRTLLSDSSAALRAFQSGGSRFAVVRSINEHASGAGRPRTLLVLDSSFNPPSKAHELLARSALQSVPQQGHPGPVRLLLLFSTHNADKAPSAASFDQRLALMSVFAEDLVSRMRNDQSAAISSPGIDIGLTTEPYYTDKSAAIAERSDYAAAGAVHVHIMGFDTVTRLFTPKYYPSFDPPLSALNPYFDAGHLLRVTIRPSDDYGSVEEQRSFLAGLGEGKLECDGGKRDWARQITIVEAGDGEGVSSTRVRQAAKGHRWGELADLCTPGIAETVRTEAIYASDDRGSKMA